MFSRRKITTSLTHLASAWLLPASGQWTRRSFDLTCSSYARAFIQTFVLFLLRSTTVKILLDFILNAYPHSFSTNCYTKVWTQLCSWPAPMRLNFRKSATAIIKLLNFLIAAPLFNLSTLSDTKKFLSPK